MNEIEKKEMEIVISNLTTLQEKFGKDYKEMISTMITMEAQFRRLNELLIQLRKSLR